jgi:hypothetical protein
MKRTFDMRVIVFIPIVLGVISCSINNGIFSTSSELNELNRSQYVRSKGDFSIFLSSDSEFIKSTSIKVFADSLISEGSIYNKARGDTLNFQINFNTKDIEDTIIRKKDHYEYSFYSKRDSFVKSTLNLYKSRDFILNPGISELVSGEIWAQVLNPSNKKPKTFKYIIINDPENLNLCLKTLLVLSDVDMVAYQAECNKRLNNKCEGNMKPKAYIKYGWHLLVFSKDVICDCGR